MRIDHVLIAFAYLIIAADAVLFLIAVGIIIMDLGIGEFIYNLLDKNMPKYEIDRKNDKLICSFHITRINNNGCFLIKGLMGNIFELATIKLLLRYKIAKKPNKYLKIFLRDMQDGYLIMQKKYKDIDTSLILENLEKMFEEVLNLEPLGSIECTEKLYTAYAIDFLDMDTDNILSRIGLYSICEV